MALQTQPRRAYGPTVLTFVLTLWLIAPASFALAQAQRQPVQQPPVQPQPVQQQPAQQQPVQQPPAQQPPAQQQAAAQQPAQQQPTAEGDAAAPSTSESDTDQPIDIAAWKQDIEQRLASLDAGALGEVEYKKINEQYQLALSSLTKLEQQKAELSKQENNIAKYDTELKEFKANLANLPEEPQSIDTSAKLDELQAKQQELETLVQVTRDELAKSEAQPKDRAARLAEIPKLKLEAQQQLAEAKKKLSGLPDQADNLAAVAQRTALQAQQRYLSKSLEAMDKQRQYYLMSGELVQTRRDYRSKKLAREEKQLAAVRDLVGKRRMSEAQQQVADAAQAAKADQPEAIAKLAAENSELAQAQADVVAKISKLEDALSEMTEQISTLEKQYASSEERIEASGMNESIGLRLRQQQEQLPNVRALEQQIGGYRNTKSEIAYRLYELYERRSEVVDVELDQRVENVLEQVPADARQSADQDVRELLESEREILESTIENYEKYSNLLTSLVADGTKLVNETRSYENYIRKNVLWIRSCTFPSKADLEPALGALKWSLDPVLWRNAGLAFWNKVQNAPTLSIVVLGTLVGLLFLQDRLRRRLHDHGAAAEKRSCTDFSLSLRATVVTLLLALPWPALLWFVGWWMEGTVEQPEFTRTLSRGLRFTAVCLLLLELVRHVCRSKGLASSHFSWPQSVVRQLRRTMRLLLCIGLPLVFWMAGLTIQTEQRLWSPTLGRLLYLVLMTLCGFVLYRLLVSHSSPMHQMLRQSAQRSKWKLTAAWVPLVVALPFLLAGLALFGYYYTAQQLTLRLMQTATLVGVLLVLGGLTKRWILLNRRQLARDQLRQKRAAAIAAAEAEGEPMPVEAPEETVDLAALGEQTNNLVQTLLVMIGLVSAWFIWGEMLPALSLIGEQSIPGFELTWGHLIRFFVVILVTSVAVKNVPALLEFAILQHLPLEAGLRYAITSMGRYLLVAIGIYLAYDALGFDSSSIQWLVAAMGVGLGFGLQEIFANFVSGIILLFEQPIRVGDIVTLGDKTGQVSRIRMRATTIIDWDRKEYVVPNKDLVTERLLNWTLTDQINRIVVIVGVAYGSDTDRACQLLIQVANDHPLTLDDPAPSAIFDGFGDSTLNLTLRCYLPSLEKRLDTIHELHTAIDKKFKAAGIEIAFPQLDLHVQHVPAKVEEALAGHQNGHTSNGTNGTNGTSAKQAKAES